MNQVDRFEPRTQVWGDGPQILSIIGRIGQRDHLPSQGCILHPSLRSVGFLVLYKSSEWIRTNKSRLVVCLFVFWGLN